MRTYYPRTKGFPWAQKRMAGESDSEIGPSGFSGEYGRFYSIKRGNMGQEERFFLLFTVLSFSRSDTADMELIALIKRTCTGSKGPRHLFVTLCG